MTTTLLPFILALAVVCWVVLLLRQRKLKEKYAVLWVLVGLLIVVLAGFPQLLGWASDLAGFAVPSNLLFTLAIFLVLGVCLHLSLEISVVEDETRALAEEAAILRAALDKLKARVDAQDAANAPGAPSDQLTEPGGTSPAPRHDDGL
ncbi:hypothetical protein ABIB35_002720 [Arthrobacter sp. UYP6]|uniref:DUF2304 domain-containing protein n=1 Tax=Arthrobacter sp. UYP6 TaxID=1756378 RepID=UPI003399ED67